MIGKNPRCSLLTEQQYDMPIIFMSLSLLSIAVIQTVLKDILEGKGLFHLHLLSPSIIEES